VTPTPVVWFGFDVRALIPSSLASFWVMAGMVVLAIPRKDDEPGDNSIRATIHLFLVVTVTVVSYLILLAPSIKSYGGIFSILQAYSLGRFQPSGGSWFFGYAVFGYVVTMPLQLLFVPGGIRSYTKKLGRRDKTLRGRSLLSFSDAIKRAEARAKQEEPGPLFGMLRLPEKVSTSHFLVCGTTGAGKTTILRLLMQSVLPKVGTGDTRALVYDAKQDILSLLHGMGIQKRIVTLNPFDERCVSWAIAKDVTSPAVAEQVATILIADERGSSNPYFFQAARSLLTGVLIAYILKCPGMWNLADVLHALRSVETLKNLLLGCPQTAYLVERYFSNEKTANDVMSTLDTKLRPYQYVAAAWSRATESISLSEWLNDEFVLVLGNDEETRSAIDAINQVIFKRLSELVISQTESRTRRTWFFLDELKEAGRLDGLTSLLTKGRSKGACVVLGFQDIEGLSVAYGDNRTAREIVGLCANKAILRTDSPMTAEWASSLLGSREVLEYRVTESSAKSKSGKQTSTSQSEQVQKRETVLPSEIMALPTSGPENGLCGYYIIPEIGAYRADVPWSQIENALMPPDLDVANVMKRPSEHQYLAPWNNADRKRLGLDSKVEQIKIPEQETSQAQGLLGNISR
jgi:Type IV secretion-system coupling protein DNA-binding domain